MNTAATVVGLCLVAVMVTAVPSKRFISIHDIEHGLHHVGHEIEHGVQHIGHEIEHGVQHLGEELAHITGIHDVKGIACKIYPHVKDAGEAACDAKCVALITATTAVYLTPACPAACHMIFHEADKLVNC